MKVATVNISGLYSGPSPSAGVGVARSLKRAYPERLKLVGVDYWKGSSGFHTPFFDDFWLMPDWNSMHEQTYFDQISAHLNEGGFWLPTLDLEISWLRREGRLQNSASILAPPQAALENSKKSKLHSSSLIKALDLRVPNFLTLESRDDELYRFFRKCSWKVWVKGAHHGATFIPNWRAFVTARGALLNESSSPARSEWIAQQHVNGRERSYAFAAYQGDLLGLVGMKKKVTTPDGKTWAGRVDVFESESREFRAISGWVREQNWTGGGEIEMIEDFASNLWINEVNPRFPAWIYGATLAGCNLPARLLARAMGETFTKEQFEGRDFSRVVLEVLVNEDIGLPEPIEQGLDGSGSVSKYGETLGGLSRKVLDFSPSAPPLRIKSKAGGAEPFAAMFDFRAETPQILHDELGVRHRISELADSFSGFSSPRLQGGYSIKTFAHRAHLLDAKKSNFFAEAISQGEVKAALAAGFLPSEIVVNGPAKSWPWGMDWYKEEVKESPLKAWFVDSVEELEECIELLNQCPEDRPFAQVLGLRLGLPQFRSRFGIDVGNFGTFSRVVSLLRKLPRKVGLGVHFHMASSAIGLGRWWDAFESVLEWGESLEGALGRRINILDFGGGWHPQDFACIDLARLHGRVKEQLIGVDSIFFEPGKALCQDRTAIATRVLEVRAPQEALVLDACIAELPLANLYPHRVWAFNEIEKHWVELGFGTGRLLGRICMEDDYLASQIEIPKWVKRGTPFLILDAGAYERSMSYEFGRGKITLSS